MQLRKLLQSPVLIWIGLISGGAGATLMTASTILYLIQEGIIGKYLVSVMALGLASFGLIVTLIGTYRTGKLEFRSFSLLTVEALLLMSIAFSFLGRMGSVTP